MIRCRHLLLGLRPSKAPEERRMDEEIEQCGADQAAEDHRRDGIEDLLARLTGSQHQRNKRNARRQRGHQHGCHPFPARTLHHLRREPLPLVPHEVQIVRDEQDAVAGCDP